MVDKMNFELAIIFKREYIGEIETFTPFKVIEGNLDEEENMFIDKNGYSYFHMLDNTPGNCFALREDIAILSQKFSKLNYSELKKQYLNNAKEYIYYVIFSNGSERIVKENKKTKKKYNFEDLDTEQMKELIRDTIDMLQDSDDIEENKFMEEIFSKASKLKPGETKILTLNAPKKEEIKVNINVQELYSELKNKIIGQDEAIRKILTSIWENYNDEKDDKSKNIFVNGPTGVGKTEIFRIISKAIKVPCVIEDANDFTISGYVGRDTQEMLIDMLRLTDGDVKQAENGILIIDEIDKLASKSNNETVATVGVQQALLKLIEDGVFPIKYKGKEILFNTKKLLVGAVGAFSTINDGFTVGFDKSNNKKLYKDISFKDFVKFGMIPEFMGRFPNVVTLNELGEVELFNITKYSELSELFQQKKFLESLNVELLYDDAVITEIAKEARKLEIGARGINTIITKMLQEAKFDISMAEKDTYKELEVLPETITNPKKYILRK